MSAAARLVALVAGWPAENDVPTYNPPVLCLRCRVDLPAAAAFCPRCGEPQSAAVRAATREWQRCEITWWRGYVKSQFVAHAHNDAGADVRIYTSPMFRWSRKRGPSQLKNRVAHAYHALLVELQNDGWVEVGRSAPWYAARFQRDAQVAWVEPTTAAQQTRASALPPPLESR